MPRWDSRDTPDRILAVAERLVQINGFNGFSYADIASELRIRNASIHHHFPSKADLGVRLLARYRENFSQALETIDRSGADPRRRLRQYARLYANVVREKNRMCLCGMLASDLGTLPRPMRKGVRGFFDDNELWLGRVLGEGRRSGSFHFDGPARVQARLVLSSLEGAMFVARSYEEVTRFKSVADRLFESLEARS